MMRSLRSLIAPILLVQLAGAATAAEPPGNLRCEWRVEPLDVRDPCPEFSWECVAQSACRILVGASARAIVDARPLVWDSGKVPGRLPIARYAGPPLKNGVDYYWGVHVWDADGRRLPDPPAEHFRLSVRPMPHHLPTIRTFINFAGEPDFARGWLDLSFRKEAKQGREEIVTQVYGLVSTMVLPHLSTGKPLSGKAKELADFCRARGLVREGIAEEMFCHFAQDTRVRLHVGAENTANPSKSASAPAGIPATTATATAGSTTPSSPGWSTPRPGRASPGKPESRSTTGARPATISS